LNHLTATHSPDLVVLSVLVAILASGAALDLAGRVTAAQGWVRLLWLLAGGFVLGLGIWAMHFTAMLAFELPVPVSYHVPTVAVSLVAAVAASWAALFAAGRDRLGAGGIAVGSLLMGSGIAGMHYIGMDAMRLAAEVAWSAPLVAASVVIALLVSAVALWLAFRFGQADYEAWTWRKLGSAVLMGAAICTMHYTGMASATFAASAEVADLTHTITASRLGGVAIVVATVPVLLVAIGLSLLDRRVTAQTRQLNAALAEVRTLRGLLPICAQCRRVRAEDGGWEQLEAYVRQRTHANFSHGFCPDCEQRWMEAHTA